MAGLQFATFSSQIELPFYTSLFASKLDHDKLDDSARYVLGLYEAKGEKDPTESTRMQLFANALTSNTVPLHMQRAEGIIRNFNTIEDFKQADKAAILQTAGRQIWDAIKDGTIYEIPSLLSSFNIISFADLKKYKFTYWVAYPALHSDPQWKRVGDIGKLTLAESGKLNEQYTTFRYANDVRQRGFFLAKKVSKAELAKQKEAAKRAKRSDEEDDDESRYHDDDGDDDDGGFEDDDDDGLDFKWVVGCLRDFEKGFFDGVEEKDRFVGFVDSSSYPENPSWPLRNLLVLIRQRFHMTKVQILCYRDTRETRHESRSIILPLAMEDVDELEISTMPKITGWERNAAGKLAARVVNLGEYMDPNRLADQAVDLNLKLMKWRLTPTLDLDVIKNTRCLLLGSGTLGSYVSRNLMGWGVRKITFVDNGSVSFSNPVRQPLFEFKDCLKGGAPKALRAAEALQQIFPGVESEGHVLSVPMLGHPIVDEAKTKKDFEKLEELMDDHDVIFLLMDTRESRWLPTVMGKAKGKIVMNAALGFDTFVVMRHGAAPKDGSEDTLGCYFCNDVVAPADSVKDQTLDQQCTVTRPGVATIASALLVELMTSILQHPQKHYAAAPVAKADSSFERDPEDHALGIVPHQIRGFLANFHNMLIRGQSYPNCSACSKPILDAFKQDSWGFVKRALENRDYVAEVSGLKEIQERAEAMAADLEWSEEEGTSDGEAVVL